MLLVTKKSYTLFRKSIIHLYSHKTWNLHFVYSDMHIIRILEQDKLDT